MENNRLKLAASIIVIVLMTGVAAAATTASLIVTNDPVKINTGETKTQTITLDRAVANPISKIEIINLPAGIDSSIDGMSGNVLTGSWTSTKIWNVELTDVGVPNDVYTITYKLTYMNDTIMSQVKKATIEAGVNAIPEFPKVAFPVAAFIGLVFLFKQERNMEE